MMTIMMQNIQNKTTTNEYDGNDDGDDHDVIGNDEILVMAILMMEDGERES